MQKMRTFLATKNRKSNRVPRMQKPTMEQKEKSWVDILIELNKKKERAKKPSPIKTDVTG